jgi:hypothetical protein
MHSARQHALKELASRGEQLPGKRAGSDAAAARFRRSRQARSAQMAADAAGLVPQRRASSADILARSASSSRRISTRSSGNGGGSGSGSRRSSSASGYGYDRGRTSRSCEDSAHVGRYEVARAAARGRDSMARLTRIPAFEERLGGR